MKDSWASYYENLERMTRRRDSRDDLPDVLFADLEESRRCPRAMFLLVYFDAHRRGRVFRLRWWHFALVIALEAAAVLLWIFGVV